MPNRVAYAALPETRVYKSATSNRTVNKILMGTWVGIRDRKGSRVKVTTAGPDGWVETADLRQDCGLKIFFVDVGQGDGMLVETPDRRILIDGGPNQSLRRYLRGWQYSYVLKARQRVRIDTVLVSHFDQDHYGGLVPLLNDKDFEFGTLYHNGIARFHATKSKRPAGMNQDLGRVSNGVLRTSFDNLQTAKDLLQQGGLQLSFRRFLEAVVKANREGRLDGIQRLTRRDKTVPGYRKDPGLVIEVVGPVPRKPRGTIDWPWFTDSSHTRNGHSLVLRLRYGGANGKTFLLGGDLNTESEEYLLKHYGRKNPFRVDVAKSCHHGSADFTVNFMDKISPYATVISSGDNESHAHPRAEAVGCAGKYSRGERPLVFSTELARSINSGGEILYGMINCRTDGKDVVLAQMKERRTGSDIWDSYVLP